MHQNMLLGEFYLRNRKENRNQLSFYQEQYKQLKGIMKYMIKNYWP